MIYYQNNSWLGLVFRYRGTVWQTIWPTLACVVGVTIVAYVTDLLGDIEFSRAGQTIFGSTMSYLLVFRANTASQRYWYGQGLFIKAQLCMREFVMFICLTTKGGVANDLWRECRASPEECLEVEDGNDIRASMARVNCVRWAVAYLLTLKIHTRMNASFYSGELDADQKWLIDWDRLRLRGLVTRAEFEELDSLLGIRGDSQFAGGKLEVESDLLEDLAEEPPDKEQAFEVNTTPEMRQPCACLAQLRLEIVRHMNEPWGFKERFAKDLLQQFSDGMSAYEDIHMLISTPLPFPYVHMCKLLLIFFLISTPMVVDSSLGWFANVVLPAMVAMSLLGIDAIAAELENPFGDDVNDLDLESAVAALEAEVMAILELTGDHRAVGAFKFVALPEALWGDGPHKVRDFLCLRSQLLAETARLPTKPPSKRRGSKCSLDSEDEDDPRRPLLSGAGNSGGEGSQGGFVPMHDFETGSVNFDSFGEKRSPGEDRDNVGLSEEEGGLRMPRSESRASSRLSRSMTRIPSIPLVDLGPGTSGPGDPRLTSVGSDKWSASSQGSNSAASRTSKTSKTPSRQGGELEMAEPFEVMPNVSRASFRQ